MRLRSLLPHTEPPDDLTCSQWIWCAYRMYVYVWQIGENFHPVAVTFKYANIIRDENTNTIHAFISTWYDISIMSWCFVYEQNSNVISSSMHWSVWQKRDTISVSQKSNTRGAIFGATSLSSLLNHYYNHIHALFFCAHINFC